MYFPFQLAPLLATSKPTTNRKDTETMGCLESGPALSRHGHPAPTDARTKPQRQIHTHCSLMNPPVTTTEPRSFADALADIRFLQQRVATATRTLLRKHGWRYTRLTPAHVWLWSKSLPGGRTVLTDINTALAFESSLAHQPPLSPAQGVLGKAPARAKP